jgi:hypothetical protein
MMTYQQPNTRLEDLVDFYNSIKSQENLAFARISSGADEDETFKALKNMRAEIERQYARVLDHQDKYSFKTLEELKKFLESTGQFSQEEISEAVDHEQEHQDAARNLGYRIDGFSCWLALAEDESVRHVITTSVALDRMIPAKDYKIIATAPRYPGRFDKEARLIK